MKKRKPECFPSGRAPGVPCFLHVSMQQVANPVRFRRIFLCVCVSVSCFVLSQYANYGAIFLWFPVISYRCEAVVFRLFWSLEQLEDFMKNVSLNLMK